jgi:hypothetical protein
MGNLGYDGLSFGTQIVKEDKLFPQQDLFG